MKPRAPPAPKFLPVRCFFSLSWIFFHSAGDLCVYSVSQVSSLSNERRVDGVEVAIQPWAETCTIWS